MKVKNCECCYMPMKDSMDSGSDKYCHYCFVDGKLLAEGMTLQAFKKRSYAEMKKKGMGTVKAWIFSRFIGMAPYWKSQSKN